MTICDHNLICPLCLKQELTSKEIILCSKCLEKETHRVKQQNKRAQKKNIEDRLTVLDWLLALDRHDFSCARCKAKGILLTLDHVVSMSSGGSNQGPYNIQPLCSPCHEIKSIMEEKQKGNKKKRQEVSLWKHIWENPMEDVNSFNDFMEKQQP
jgi:hypothetical protein